VILVDSRVRVFSWDTGNNIYAYVYFYMIAEFTASD